MSLFLAPIHELMYDKIHLQDFLAEKLIENLGDINAKKAFSNTLATEKGDLSQVIDKNNIHGWLQNQVNISEDRFADAVKLLTLNNVSVDEMKDFLYSLGKDTHYELSDAASVFQLMNKLFLDGMPCDHINSIVDRTDSSLTFTRSKNIHADFFNERGLNGDLYFELRDSYLKGILDDTNFDIFENTQNSTNTFTIKEKN